MILFEGSRDNLLQPYRDLLAQRGMDMSLSQFKQLMHQKLTVEAGMDALSQGSNFYLAGAVRYYFDGALTENKQLGVLYGTQDKFRQDVCSTLNDIIILLRNSYIDSVGSKWEVPEDFGTLSIDKLFKKYVKKLEKTRGAGGENLSTAQVTKDAIGDYSIEVILSQDQLRKYQPLTNPGSWCITYSDPKYYNYYTKENDSFFVIFARQGYENTPYEVGKEFPRDDYGTSLIAVQLSKAYGNLVGATTRWNHGGYQGVPNIPNADNVWRSTEELCNDTGIDPALVAKAFELYKNSAALRKQMQSVERKKENAIKKQKVRDFKYIQMLLNQGQSLENLQNNGAISEFSIIAGNGKVSKTLAVIYRDYDGQRVGTICNRGNLAFNSVILDDAHSSVFRAFNWDNHQAMPAVLQCTNGTQTTYYDVALNDIIRFNGKKITATHGAAYGIRFSENDEQERYCWLEANRKKFYLYNVAKHEIIQSPRGEGLIERIGYGDFQSTHLLNIIYSFFKKDIPITLYFQGSWRGGYENVSYDFERGVIIDMTQYDIEDTRASKVCGQMSDGTRLIQGWYKEQCRIYYFYNNGIVPFNGIKLFRYFQPIRYRNSSVSTIDNALAFEYTPFDEHNITRAIIYDNQLKREVPLPPVENSYVRPSANGLIKVEGYNQNQRQEAVYDAVYSSFVNIEGDVIFYYANIQRDVNEPEKRRMVIKREKNGEIYVYGVLLNKPGGTVLGSMKADPRKSTTFYDASSPIWGGFRESKQGRKVLKEYFVGTPDNVTDNKTGKHLQYKSSETLSFGFFPAGVGETPSFFSKENVGHEVMCKEIADKILNKYRYSDEDYMLIRKYLADEIYRASTGLGRIWLQNKLLTLWYALSPEDLKTTLEPLGGWKKYADYKLVTALEVNITVGQYIRRGNIFIENEAKKQSSWFKPFKEALVTPFESDSLDSSMLKIPDNYMGKLAKKSEKLNGMTIAQYNSLIHPFESFTFGGLKKLVEQKLRK